MFVSPDSKREGAFYANIPIVWGLETVYRSRYFGCRGHGNPQEDARRFADEVLVEEYGLKRASYIRAIPHYVNRMKFGCGVGLVYTLATSRQKKYPIILCTWSESIREDGRYKNYRRRKSWCYNELNKRYIEHKANLFAARKRALLTHSIIDHGVFHLDFDLEA
jgi:hypothetical protein